MPRLSLQPTRIFSVIEGQDETGQLVFYDDRLAAVLIKLGSMHEEQEGFWNLEVGFGLCAGRPATFRHLADALRWVGERCLADTDDLETQVVDVVRGR